MGNSASLSVDLHSSSVATAGSVVSGSITVEVTKEVAAKGLEAFAKGEESCEVQYQERQSYRDSDGNHKTRSVTRYKYAHRPILAIPIPIETSGQIGGGSDLLPGTYVFPFELELPDFLPSSLTARGDGGNCEIRYFIQARLAGSRAKVTQNFEVLAAPLSKDPVPHVVQPKTEKVNFCCCFNKGTLTVGANVDDTVIGRGEVVGVGMACRNDSTVDIKDVTATVYEHVAWHAQGKSNSTGKALAKKVFGQVAGLDKKTKSQLRLKVANRANPETEHHDHILREMVSSTNRIFPEVPALARDTYAGQLIQCSHSLHIHVRTGQCIDNIDLHIPLQIGRPSGSDTTTATTPTTVPASAPQEQPSPSAPPPPGLTSQVSQANLVFVPSSAAVTGGVVVESEDSNVYSYISPQAPATVSLETILKELDASLSDLDVVKKKCEDSAWAPVFESLTPQEYGAIIKKVDLDWDQPKVAVLMAPKVKSFTVDYCVAAVRGTSEFSRATMVQKLLPFCVDLADRQDVIKAELSDWEKVVVEQDFANCLQGDGKNYNTF